MDEPKCPECQHEISKHLGGIGCTEMTDQQGDGVAICPCTRDDFPEPEPVLAVQ